MVASFCKQIGDSLVAFGVGHQIVKHEYVPFTCVYNYNVGRLDGPVCRLQILSLVLSS